MVLAINAGHMAGVVAAETVHIAKNAAQTKLHEEITSASRQLDAVANELRREASVVKEEAVKTARDSTLVLVAMQDAATASEAETAKSVAALLKLEMQGRTAAADLTKAIKATKTGDGGVGGGVLKQLVDEEAANAAATK